PSEAEFWALTSHSAAMPPGLADRFTEYLKRVMLHAAPLASPQDLAWFLASYARDAKSRIEVAGVPALASVRKALEEALGLRFEGAKGEHFFRSTLVQTLFYGIFSAWVLWRGQNPSARKDQHFDWRVAAYELHVPMIRALFEEVSKASQLKQLGLIEVMEWTGATLDRVDQAAFFARFEEAQAVQYFYEPFLQAFDPELRKDLGVWYTPPEIVKYMVARVDTVLREELNLPDGLADPNVYVLDPCCGTGAYLVEVLNTIRATLAANGGDALGASDLKKAAMERVFGFEILPAPFVVAHLQLGLLLRNAGAPLSDDLQERAGVFLTNALTGWDPAKEPKTHLLFPEMEAERDAANEVKQAKPILVILGNPPYNAFAGTSPKEEQGLVEPYKKDLNKPVAQGGWGIKKYNLDDLYIRFFRLAERGIAEKTGKGVVCYISNHSWVSDPSFVVMRQHLLGSFDRFWIENMHGNRKISEYAPDGKTSETVFALAGFSSGIQQGVAISLWVKDGSTSTDKEILFRDDLTAAKAAERRAVLLASLHDPAFETHYLPANPKKSNRFSFQPSEVAAHYDAWPKLIDLCAEGPYQGLAEDRRKALIDTLEAPLKLRMRRYFDASVRWEVLKAEKGPLTDDYVDFPAKQVREKLLKTEGYVSSNLRRFAMRPFDTQFCYFTPARPVWRRHRPEFYRQAWAGNNFITSRFNASKVEAGAPLCFVGGLCDYHYITPNVGAFPIRILPAPPKASHESQAPLFELDTLLKANLSSESRAYLAGLGITNPDADAETAGLIWMHALAIGYSPAYLSENADGIRGDWPRIPLPLTREALERSAALGRLVAALLDTEAPVAGVTNGPIREELKTVGSIQRTDGGQLDVAGGDLRLTAGWGHGGQGGVTMPGKGKSLERPFSTDELAAIAAGAAAMGRTPVEI
ncbi:MAG: N-6 DNA methylase, partial [Armatimonadota bacterium]|nr:N-6 DNA methylase [Armatimonadota bacterium]